MQQHSFSLGQQQMGTQLQQRPSATKGYSAAAKTICNKRYSAAAEAKCNCPEDLYVAVAKVG